MRHPVITGCACECNKGGNGDDEYDDDFDD